MAGQTKAPSELNNGRHSECQSVARSLREFILCHSYAFVRDCTCCFEIVSVMVNSYPRCSRQYVDINTLVWMMY